MHTHSMYTYRGIVIGQHIISNTVWHGHYALEKNQSIGTLLEHVTYLLLKSSTGCFWPLESSKALEFDCAAS